MKDPACWFVYMLECENGSYYTGCTDDMARRYEEHRKGTAKSKYTRSFRPVRIAGCWRLRGSKGAALKIERVIQGMNRRMKEEIVADPSLLLAAVAREHGDDFGIVPFTCSVPEEARDITRYLLTLRDKKLRNPYLEEVLSIIRTSRLEGEGLSRLLNDKRSDFASRYAFSIPTIDIIEEIARYSPLIEIGAGSGYWAMCLSEAGADIVAYDSRPPGEAAPWDWRFSNRWHEESWFHVIEGDEAMAGRYPERALLLCWPPIHDPMAARALRFYLDAGGKTLIWIESPGASADEAFRRQVESLRMLRSARLWSWPGFAEEMRIFDLTPRPPLPQGEGEG
ncbi:MAG: GIY-YIG nuclease family protein [Spirochaetes bacterium]|nr:GIY-YIG nuclease family protein [Spirochaetota bacterium]